MFLLTGDQLKMLIVHMSGNKQSMWKWLGHVPEGHVSMAMCTVYTNKCTFDQLMLRSGL